MRQELQYDHYHFSPKELCLYLVEGVTGLLAAAWLFYNSLFAAVLCSPLLLVFLKKKGKQLNIKRQEQLNQQFKDALVSLKSAVGAGYAIENAFRETYHDLKLIYEENSYIVKEFQYMIAKLEMNVPIEHLLTDFGERSQVEDIQNFAEIFGIAKRTKGELGKIMERTVRIISEKIEVKQEIRTMMAAKQLEQRIMCVIPFGLIFYMRIGFPGFLDKLYGQAGGVILMSICLGIYTGAFLLGEKIVRIEV